MKVLNFHCIIEIKPIFGKGDRPSSEPLTTLYPQSMVSSQFLPLILWGSVSGLESRIRRFSQCFLLCPPNNTLLSGAISFADGNHSFSVVHNSFCLYEGAFLLVFDQCESTFGLCLCIDKLTGTKQSARICLDSPFLPKPHGEGKWNPKIIARPTSSVICHKMDLHIQCALLI